jgi:rod shape determining protein RodA
MIALLVLVHLFGTEVLGARRWIDFGVFQLQPSEVAKIIFIIILAKYFSGLSGRPSLREVARSGVYLLLPLSLVVTQPDLGTALVFIAIWGVFLLAARVRPLHLAGLLTVSVLITPLIWRSLKPYQQSRLLTFLDPARDPLGAGYNVTQAQIAVGSGGLWGRGLGHGTQSQLNFLPVQHTDFIFAALVEELGFVGAIGLFILYALLFSRSLRAVSRSRDLFGMYLAVGITAMLLFHIFVNVGMNLGIMPVTGIPLPLVSYGGTAVIMTFVSLGLLQSVISRARSG